MCVAPSFAMAIRTNPLNNNSFLTLPTILGQGFGNRRLLRRGGAGEYRDPDAPERGGPCAAAEG